MIETVYAQLRFATSLLFARPFHLPSLERLVDSLLSTQLEFGRLDQEASTMLRGPSLSTADLLEMKARRFRHQAQLAMRETDFYAALFRRLPLDPHDLTAATIEQLPLTTKDDLRMGAGAFLRRGAQPTLCTTTTGTTGDPLHTYFTRREMHLFSLMGALNLLLQGALQAGAIVQVSTSARASLANSVFMASCQRVGALVYQTGIIDPAQALARLTECHTLAGKPVRAGLLLTYPSYLGRLVTYGLENGYTADDFGVQRISLGGEVVTEALKQRCRALFGEITFVEAYGITEVYPFGGTVCEVGNLHCDAWSGLAEVVDPTTARAVAPGDIGTLVLTPFAPFRESMVVLRYDTEDLVQRPVEPCSCSLAHLPVIGKLMGKRRHAIQVDRNLITARHVMEAVESVPGLPLPARCGIWQEGEAVIAGVVTPLKTAQVLSALSTNLQIQGVNADEVRLLADMHGFPQMIPLRGDLHERSYGEAFHVNPITNLFTHVSSAVVGRQVAACGG